MTARAHNSYVKSSVTFTCHSISLRLEKVENEYLLLLQNENIFNRIKTNEY